jgi:glutathione S-transferase
MLKRRVPASSSVTVKQQHKEADMIIYGASISPYVRKAVAYMREKQLDFTHELAMPGSNEAWFRELSPFGKIPAFLDGDFGLSDSTVIIHYLESKFPEPAMIPADPELRAKTLWWEEFADTILAPCVAAIFYNRVAAPAQGRPFDLAIADKAQAEDLGPILSWLEGQIPDSGFLVNDRVSVADIAVAALSKNLDYSKAAIDAASFPRLTAWRSAILSRPSFAELLAQDMAMLSATK